MSTHERIFWIIAGLRHQNGPIFALLQVLPSMSCLGLWIEVVERRSSCSMNKQCFRKRALLLYIHTRDMLKLVVFQYSKTHLGRLLSQRRLYRRNTRRI